MNRRASVGVLALATLMACGQAEQPSGDSPVSGQEGTSSSAARSDPPDSATVAAAIETLRRFLDASREGSPTQSSLGALTACNSADAVRAAGPMLAAYELLPALARADTVIGRAVVTTVAEQDVDRRHPGYFIARVRVRSDTLEWDVVPTGDGAWVVCNGLSFGLTAPDSLTEWRPPGASLPRARALADSIAAATEALRDAVPR